jgi:hypothetical protein
MAQRVPTLFVDSLTFMWNAIDVERIAALNNCLYVVQDVFDSREAAARCHLPDAVFVEPIVDLNANLVQRVPIVANLGGMVIHGDTVAARRYLDGAVRVLSSLPDRSSTVILTSAAMVPARTSARSTDGPRIKNVSHSDAIGLFTQADLVLTTPGLTTLLELAALRIKCLPLPPLNYSQCLILNRIANRRKHSASVWDLLADWFDAPVGLPEKEGVRWTQARLGEFLASQDVLEQYIELLRSERDAAKPPDMDVTGFNGAAQIATLLKGAR